MLTLFFVVLMAGQLATPLPSSPGTINGVLRSADNQPLAGARVALRPADSDEKGSLISIGQTDGDGRYQLENVPPGRYYILLGSIATPLYYPGVSSTTGAAIITVSGGAVVELPTVTLPKPQRLAGRLVDAESGLPVSADRIVVCSDPNCRMGRIDQRVIAATLGPGGTFEFPELAPGEYSLRISGPDIVSLARSVSINSGFGPAAPMEVRLTRGVTLGGVVVDSAGRPSTLVQVFLQKKSESSTARTIVPSADGSFTFRGLAPGTYLLGVQSPQLVGPGQEVEAGPLGLFGVKLVSPFVELRGRMEMDDGTIVPADFVARIQVAHFTNPGTRRYVLPVETGRFAAALVPGELQLSIESLPTGYSLASLKLGELDLTKQPLDLKEPISEEIVLKLRR